ncbi:MAG TPA: DNA glycosylase [Candidatus Eisenbacteria bacterium]|nr:DNA glycosylase [Candidatus Eisenbacteria bacterium]
MDPPGGVVVSSTATSYRISSRDFNLDATLDSGQVFGFVREPDGWSGRIGGQPVRLAHERGRLRAEGAVTQEALRLYFDLDRDLGPLYAHLEGDARLLPALEKYRGLRLIRQDPWEALACFILSSNNNVKRIRHIWRNLSSRLGGGGFPSAAAVARVHERTLRELGLGYRAPFLSRSAQFVAASPASLSHIRETAYGEARERVLAFPGIGPKVADCVLLYGFQKYEAFPVDVWILRVMRKLYFSGRRVSPERVRFFAAKRWGSHAGYLQQYLFHGVRTGIL